MNSPDLAPPSNQGDLQLSQGLLLTGEGLASMTLERLKMLEQMVGGLGLRITVAGEAENENHHEEEPAPIPATLKDFRDFALENGYSNRRAIGSWRIVCDSGLQAIKYGKDSFPDVQFLGPGPDEVLDDHLIVDLRSVYDRLAYSRRSPAAWRWRAAPLPPESTINFLAHVVNESVQPDEKLFVELPKK